MQMDVSDYRYKQFHPSSFRRSPNDHACHNSLVTPSPFLFFPHDDAVGYHRRKNLNSVRKAKNKP
ncbi:hypothetical protein M426DRAFT_111213 [Hypoxylon sp. CI-4A]|nr:hypothetical protein M426DRAFT_111213 [Hypoxylon sp. CI-4A]